MKSTPPPRSSPPEEQMFVYSVVGLLWRQKGKVLLCVLSVMSLSIVYLATAERIYESQAKLYLGAAPQPVTVDGQPARISTADEPREREVNAVVELLNSRLIAEAAVDHFGAEVILEKRDSSVPSLGQTVRDLLEPLDEYHLNPLRVYSLRDKAIEQFQESLQVLAMKTSSVMAMSYECGEPAQAQEVLEFVVQTTMDENSRVHRTPGSQEFFVNQSALLRDNLSQLESQLRDLKNESGIAALESQRQLQLELVGTLKQELITLSAEQQALEAELQQRQEQLQTTPEQVVTLQTTDQAQALGQTLREKLFDLETRERELATMFTDENPLLQQIRKQLAEAKQMTRGETEPAETTMGRNPNYQAAELAVGDKQAALVAVKARTTSLSNDLAKALEEVSRINEAELRMRELELEITLASDNYRRYSDSLEEARIHEELQQARISSLTVMQPPTFSETPINPSPLTVLGAAFVLSCCLGCGLALLTDRGPPRQDEDAGASADQRHTAIPTPKFSVRPTGRQPAAAAESARREAVSPQNPR